MSQATARLLAWVDASSASAANSPSAHPEPPALDQVRTALDQVRTALDADLDTPAALLAIDVAAAAGEDVQQAAQLLGVDLTRPVLLTGVAV